MLSDLPELSQLPENPNRKTIIRETLLQLDKDTGFGLLDSGLVLENTASILRFIEQKITEKGGTQSNEIRSILYRIDLPEKRFRELPRVEQEAIQVLSGMMLERAFMKIRMRLPALFV